MKISTAIKLLAEIQEKFGDIKITGGYMMDTSISRNITVTNSEGSEIWPRDVNGHGDKYPVDGVFLES